MDRVGQKERMGVCLDTCHVYDGGYDIIGDLDGVLQVFDDIIGLDRLKAIHLNDSLNDRGRIPSAVIRTDTRKSVRVRLVWQALQILSTTRSCAICRFIWKHRTRRRATPKRFLF